MRAAIDRGATTAIVASAGTEQNGPHMTLGKHRYIVEAAAEQIARRLGDTLVAPVVTYVPEGEVDPPTGHMQFAGTLTLPEPYFMKVVEYAARSLAVHGFTDILFIGDSGGNQTGMAEVAAALSEEWAGDPSCVYFLSDYFSDPDYKNWLLSQGETEATIGRHGGIEDTSLLLAISPEHVRLDQRRTGLGVEIDGVGGDPTRATADYGRRGLQFRVDAAVRQARRLMAAECLR